MNSRFDSQPETLETEEDSDEISKLQNQNEFLNKELCSLRSQLQTQELENLNLREENESVLEKIKNYEDYFESCGEGNGEGIKDRLLEQEKEIEKLNEFIQEDLINTENMQNEYEAKISHLKTDLLDIEQENEQLKAEMNNLKESYRTEIENCFNNITHLRDEKEQCENSLNKEIEMLQSTIKSQQDKIDFIDKEYKEHCVQSELKLKTTTDKFMREIKSLKQKANYLTENAPREEIDEMNKANQALSYANDELKLENSNIKKENEKLQNEISLLLKERDDLSQEISNNKEHINELEEQIDKLKTDLLNSNINNSILNESNERDFINGGQLKEKYEKTMQELEKYKRLESVIKATAQMTFKLKTENKRLMEENAKLKNANITTINKDTGPRRNTLKPNDRKLLRFAEMASLTSANTSNNINKSFVKSTSNETMSTRQVQFLTEQNKSYQKDIENLTKSKTDLMVKIKDITKSKCNVEEQLISKEREIMKYRTLCNRLKLKIKELSNANSNHN